MDTLPFEQATPASGHRQRTVKSSAPATRRANSRVAVTLSTAAEMGLTTGAKTKRLSGRAAEALVTAASANSGLEGSDLLEYALAKIAIEDDFGQKLLAREGTVDPTLDLEF